MINSKNWEYYRLDIPEDGLKLIKLRLFFTMGSTKGKLPSHKRAATRLLKKVQSLHTALNYVFYIWETKVGYKVRVRIKD